MNFEHFWLPAINCSLQVYHHLLLFFAKQQEARGILQWNSLDWGWW